MNVIEWAQSVKQDLVKLQQETGIPALWAAAQMCHESAVDGGDGLSGLAREAHNYAGLKWADWEKTYGCEPVTYGTWEVLNGQEVDLNDAFCKCPDFQTWLKVYGGLLTGHLYSPALQYASDPFLYGYQVWQGGWATDPNYLVGTGAWMARLFDIYADTIPSSPKAQVAVALQKETVTVKDGDGNTLCEGWLEGEQTVAPVRKLAEALGLTVEWDEATQTVTLRR